MLQSDAGNSKIEGLTFPQGTIIVAAKEYNNILYIVTKQNNTVTIGSYPGVVNGELINEFMPLNNLIVNNSRSDFSSDYLKVEDSADIELQQAYDGSVNIILSDGKHPPLLVNSGFRVEGSKIEINNTVYDSGLDLAFDTQLVKPSRKLTKAKFLGTRIGGGFLCGNYRFIFRYSDKDGNESDIFAETNNIPVFIGSFESGIESVRGGDLNENANKSVEFMLQSIDTSYDYIKISYERITSDINESLIYEYYKIDSDIKINSTDQKIVLSGFDSTIRITAQEAFKVNSVINSAKSITQAGGCLFAANLGSGTDYEVIRDISNDIRVEQYITPAADGIGSYKVGSGGKISKYEWLTEDDFVRILKRDMTDGVTSNKIYKLYNNGKPFRIDTKELVESKLEFKGILDLNGSTLDISCSAENHKGIFYSANYATIQNGRINSSFGFLDSGLKELYAGGICSGFNCGYIRLINVYINFIVDISTATARLTAAPIIGSASGSYDITTSKISVWLTGPGCRDLVCNIANTSDKLDNCLIDVSVRDLLQRPVYSSFEIAINSHALNIANVIVSPIIDAGDIAPRIFKISNTYGKNMGGRYIYIAGEPDNRNIEIVTPPNQETQNYTEYKSDAYSAEFFSSSGLSRHFDISDYSFDGVSVKYSTENISDIKEKSGYYSENSLYYKLGYWPKEFYKFGVSFIMNDGSITPAIELNTSNNESVLQFGDESNIFKDPSNITPYGVKFKFDEYSKNRLINNGVIGYIPLRQKRIQNVLFHGLALNTTNNGVNTFKIMSNGEESTNYYVETYVASLSNTKMDIYEGVDDCNMYGFPANYKESSGVVAISNNYNITSPDIILNGEYFSSILNGTECIVEVNKINNKYNSLKKVKNLFYTVDDLVDGQSSTYSINTSYIPQNCKGKKIEDVTHRTTYGVDTDIQSTPFIKMPNISSWAYSDERYIRGESMQYVAVNCSGNIGHKYITAYYMNPEVDKITLSNIRDNDKSPYYAIDERIDLLSTNEEFIHYGGDCFIGDFITRQMINYTDKETPLQDVIISNSIEITSTKRSAHGGVNLGDFKKDGKNTYNIADLNAVRIGYWIRSTNMSNVNHILRSIDESNSYETALKRERGFFPYNPMSIEPQDKVLDSDKMNKGYSVTCSGSPFYSIDTENYISDYFPTKIIYSKPDVASVSINNYRVFENLAYAEFPISNGEIQEIHSIGNYIIVIFEHGVGILPIQERVLTGSGIGGDVYVTSPNVITDNIQWLSDSYGASKNGTIKSAFGVYGIDIRAKKIWRTNGQSFENISDFTIQNLLNEIITEKSQVKLHYDKNKHIVYFDFGNKVLSYNENISKFVGFHGWTSQISCSHLGRFITFNKSENETAAWKHLSFGEPDVYSEFYGIGKYVSVKFTVNTEDPTNQKIYNNLKIISNDTMPKIIQYFIPGDSYGIADEIIAEQEIKDVKKTGRRLGNASYKENIVDIQIPSVVINNKHARIRNKYIGVNLIYDSGKYTIIRSVVTLYANSYA